MANRYWVAGGTGNWNSTTNWSTASGGASGASVPGSADAALFDASSGSGTATLDISPTIQTLTCTGFTGTLAFGTNTISLNTNGTVFTGATTMTVTGTPLIILTSPTTAIRSVVPTAVTEANSISFRITQGTGTLSFSTGAVRDLDFTDGTNPTGYAGAFGGTTSITVYGNFKASTGMTKTAGTGTFTFAATSGTKTINTAGVTFDNPFTFNGVGGTWQLQGAVTIGTTRTANVTNGSLLLNNYTLTAGNFSSSSSNTRTITFGTGSIVITGSSWNTATVTNLTTDASGTISMNSASAKTFAGGGGTWGKLQNSGAGALTITGANTFMELNNSVSPAFFVFPASTTTSAYSFTLNGTASNLVSLRSSAPGTAYTLVKL